MAITQKDIERVSGPYSTRKFEFIYSDFYPVKEDVAYYNVYTKDKKKKYLDTKLRLIVPIKDNSSFQVYTNTKQNIKREVYLKPYKVIITNRIRKSGSVIRYFAKSILDESISIFEIKQSDFHRQTNFYEKASLNWIITGQKKEVKEKNESSLQIAEGTLKGIRYFLNPLQFYEENEILTPLEKIQEKLSRLKFPPESTDTSSNGGTTGAY
tara:strand:- start:106 stop:738 length:633 start_codon:yes stop_codon:yes gene_type:complete